MDKVYYISIKKNGQNFGKPVTLDKMLKNTPIEELEMLEAEVL